MVLTGHLPGVGITGVVILVSIVLIMVVGERVLVAGVVITTAIGMVTTVACTMVVVSAAISLMVRARLSIAIITACEALLL